jgi:hypothetical protein
VGTTKYISPLKPGEDRLRFELETKRGRVIKFVIQYETLVKEEWRSIVRYDTAHRYAHKDVLDWKGGVIEKIPLRDVSYKQAVEIAIDDIESNWETYKKRFLKGR